MRFRSFLILSLVALPMLGSCTTRYQDLLRDRDSTIRELRGQNAALRANNDELERQLASSRSESDQLRTRPATAQPESAGTASRLQAELEGDASVGYRRGRLSIAIDDSVTFDSGSTSLKDTGHKVLQRVAAAIKRDYGDRRIYIEGHTDSDPIQRTKDKFRDNRHLSTERADSVARYLISKCGIPESRLVVVGFGPFDPRAQGSTDSAKSRNRRVEIVVGEPITP